MREAIAEWCRQKGFPAAPKHIDELVGKLERIQKANEPFSRATTAVKQKIANVGDQRRKFAKIRRIFTGPKNRKNRDS